VELEVRGESKTIKTGGNTERLSIINSVLDGRISTLKCSRSATSGKLPLIKDDNLLSNE